MATNKEILDAAAKNAEYIIKLEIKIERLIDELERLKSVVGEEDYKLIEQALKGSD